MLPMHARFIRLVVNQFISSMECGHWNSGIRSRSTRRTDLYSPLSDTAAQNYRGYPTAGEFTGIV